MALGHRLTSKNSAKIPVEPVFALIWVNAIVSIPVDHVMEDVIRTRNHDAPLIPEGRPDG
jgi:hypothetical protein